MTSGEADGEPRQMKEAFVDAETAGRFGWQVQTPGGEPGWQLPAAGQSAGNGGVVQSPPAPLGAGGIVRVLRIAEAAFRGGRVDGADGHPSERSQ